MKNVRALDSVATSLPTDHGVPGSIPGGALGFSLAEYFTMVCTDWVFIYLSVFFIRVLTCVVFRRDPCTLLTAGLEKPFN